MEAEQRCIHPVRTLSHQAGEFPAQEDPDILQEQTDAEQENRKAGLREVVARTRRTIRYEHSMPNRRRDSW